jgi:hypothetical protein
MCLYCTEVNVCQKLLTAEALGTRLTSGIRCELIRKGLKEYPAGQVNVLFIFHNVRKTSCRLNKTHMPVKQNVYVSQASRIDTQAI